MSITNLLLSLQMDLAKYPETEPDWAANRQLILREALTKAEQQGYEEGYADALRDDADARLMTRNAERKQREKEKADAGG